MGLLSEVWQCEDGLFGLRVMREGLCGWWVHVIIRYSMLNVEVGYDVGRVESP